MASNTDGLSFSKSKAKSSRREGAGPRENPKLQDHSFLTDRADVKQMEQGLLELMDKFNHGKLHAFGRDCTLEKMDKVRERQERLANLHFELDTRETDADEGLGESGNANGNLEKLMKDLEILSSTVQSLHQGEVSA